MTDLNIGARLRDLRIQRGLTQREFAVQAGISNSYLCDIERGRTDPTIAALDRILDALGMELSAFFGLLDLNADEWMLLHAYRTRDAGMMLSIIAERFAQEVPFP